jgi:hypothetical protein
MHGDTQGHIPQVWPQDQNEEVNLNELRANSMIQRFDSETNRNVALIFSKGYPRQGPFRVAICRWFMCPVMRRLGYGRGHMALPRLKLLAGRAVLGEREQRLLTLNSLLAMFIALIGIWVGTPAFSSSVFVPLHISQHDFRKRV